MGQYCEAHGIIVYDGKEIRKTMSLKVCDLLFQIQKSSRLSRRKWLVERIRVINSLFHALIVWK